MSGPGAFARKATHSPSRGLAAGSLGFGRRLSPPTLGPVLLAITSTGRTILGVMGVGALVIGFLAVFALAVFVIKKAPPDGSDIGRDPRLEADEHKRQNGSGKHTRRP